MKKTIMYMITLVFLFCTAEGATKYSLVKDYLIGLEKYPNVKVFTLAASDSGDTIEGVSIGTGELHSLVVATHHGNESGGTEVAKALALDLSTNPIKDQTVFIIPVLNIFGYNSNTREEMAGGRSYDPNRDYPGPCKTGKDFSLKSTKSLADFLGEKNILISATLHTFSPAVVYPWGISTTDVLTGYEPEFKNLVKLATVESKYQTGNSTEVVYAADGTFEDYAFWKYGIWSILFEIGTTHSPSATQLTQWVKVNVPGIRRMLENTPNKLADKHDFTGKCSPVRQRVNE